MEDDYWGWFTHLPMMGTTLCEITLTIFEQHECNYAPKNLIVLRCKTGSAPRKVKSVPIVSILWNINVLLVGVCMLSSALLHWVILFFCSLENRVDRSVQGSRLWNLCFTSYATPLFDFYTLKFSLCWVIVSFWGKTGSSKYATNLNL